MNATKAEIAIWITVGLVLAGIIVHAAFFSQRARVRRKLRKTPRIPMNELRDGDIACVTGTVVYTGATLIAPFSGRKCSYFHIIVEQYRSTGKSGNWQIMVDDEATADVVITDGRMAAIINARAAETFICKDREYQSGFLNDANQRMVDYLSSKGIKPTTWIGLNRTMRYREGIVEAGEKLTVAGKARWIRKSDTSLEIPAERVLRLEPCDDEPLYFTDETIH